VTFEITRGAFVVRTASALAVGGGALGALAGAARAATLPDNDLAYLRVAIASELLAIDFYTNAIAAKQLSGSAAGNLVRALANEKAHYDALAQALQSAGQTPAVAGDIDFTYPKGSFDSRGAIVKLGYGLENIFVGVALGAVGGLQTPAVRLPVAQIAANEAQHLSNFALLTGHGAIGGPFPPSLSIDEATAALSAFES
jgi:hypothetical protein